MSVKGAVHVGTSGWNFDSWVGSFYPEDKAGDALLSFYSESFDTVELNNSFYQLPAPHTVRKWVGDTPAGFLFSVKASRYLTHMKKLKDPGEGLDHFLAAIEPFGDKLGPVLFQLPPNWRVNVDRLARFLELLPERHRYVFEFRDPSWFCRRVYDVLRDRGAALCHYDFQQYRSPEVHTADFVYVRLHGPGEPVYTGSYDGRTIAGLARRVRRWRGHGRDVFCYFDNDQKGCAPGDAMQLRESLARQVDN